MALYSKLSLLYIPFETPHLYFFSSLIGGFFQLASLHTKPRNLHPVPYIVNGLQIIIRVIYYILYLRAHDPAP